MLAHAVRDPIVDDALSGAFPRGRIGGQLGK
jgi:hypothetical protein